MSNRKHFQVAKNVVTKYNYCIWQECSSLDENRENGQIIVYIVNRTPSLLEQIVNKPRSVSPIFDRFLMLGDYIISSLVNHILSLQSDRPQRTLCVL